MQFHISCNTHTATKWWAEMELNMHHNRSKSFWPFQYLWRAPLPKWQQPWGIAVRPPSTCTCLPPQSQRTLKWHNLNWKFRWWKQSCEMRISERNKDQAWESADTSSFWSTSKAKGSNCAKGHLGYEIRQHEEHVDSRTFQCFSGGWFLPMDPRNPHNVSSRKQINVILDLKYVLNVVRLHYFTSLTRIISYGDREEFQSFRFLVQVCSMQLLAPGA